MQPENQQPPVPPTVPTPPQQPAAPAQVTPTIPVQQPSAASQMPVQPLPPSPQQAPQVQQAPLPPVQAVQSPQVQAAPVQPQETASSPAVQPTPLVASTQTVNEGNVDGATDTQTELPEVQPIQWQAPEYSQHNKPPMWYIVFGIVVVALMGIAVYFGAWSFVVLIPLMAVALVMYTHHAPEVISYVVSNKGLYINDTLHPIGEFRSFGVIQEHENNTLVLVPVKRFRPALIIGFPSEIGEALVDLLGAYVPMKDVDHDVYDKILRKLHI